MFLISSRCSATRFTDIVVVAGAVIPAGAGVVVDDAVNVQFVQLVLWMDEMLSERAPGSYGGGNADFLQ